MQNQINCRAAYFVISAKKITHKEFKYYTKACLFNIVQNIPHYYRTNKTIETDTNVNKTKTVLKRQGLKSIKSIFFILKYIDILSRLFSNPFLIFFSFSNFIFFNNIFYYVLLLAIYYVLLLVIYIYICNRLTTVYKEVHKYVHFI